MKFGEAIEAMKEGKKVTRKGWNGKGIFIELQVPDKGSKMTSPYIYIDTTGLQTDNVDAPKSLVPWLASQTDILADDWVAIGISKTKIPAYRCHKLVRAAKITSIDEFILNKGGDWILRFGCISNRANLVVSDEYMNKHNPKVGGYFVVYEDGYQSWSPAEAFESGYTMIEQDK